MATEADTPDPASLMKREAEDKELTSELSGKTVKEVPLEKDKKFESWIGQLPETIKIMEKTENIQVANDSEVADVNVANKVKVEANEGEFFLQSPSDAVEKQEKSTEVNQLGTKNELSGSQEEKGGMITEKNVIEEANCFQNAEVIIQTPDLEEGSSKDIGKLGEVCDIEENMENVSSANTTSIKQVLEEISFEEDKISKTCSSPESAEMNPETIPLSKDIENKKYVGEELLCDVAKDVCTSQETACADDQKTDDATENGETAKHKLDSSTVTALTEETGSAKAGLDASGNLGVYSGMTSEEGSQEKIELVEKINDVISTKDETPNETAKEESETGLRDIVKESQHEAENHNESLENIASANGSLSTTDNVDEHPEADVSSRDPEESMRNESKGLAPIEALTTECKHEGVMAVEGEDNFVTEVQDQTETSKQEEHPEWSLMQKTEPTAKNLESPLNVASEEIETTAPVESAATITNIEERRPMGSPEENLGETKRDKVIIPDDINMKEIPEEKNPSTVDLDEKITSAEVEIQNNDSNELNVTQPSTGETVQMGSEKQDGVSVSELGDQVHDADKAPKEVEKQTNETYEANKSPDSTVLEHALTEGARNIDKLDEGCELNYEEELKKVNTLDNIKEVMEEREKTVDREFHIATNSDENENFTIEEDVPIMINTPLCTREEANQQGQEDKNRPNSSEEAASKSDSGDQGCTTSNDTENVKEQIITEEVIQECEDYKTENRGEETEKDMKNEEHTTTDNSPESTCKDKTKCSQEDEAEAKKCKAEVEEELENISGGEIIEKQALAEENRVQDLYVVSSGEELEAGSSKENAMMSKMPKEEVLEVLQTDDGSANIVVQVKEKDETAKDDFAACAGDEIKNEHSYEEEKNEKEPDTNVCFQKVDNLETLKKESETGFVKESQNEAENQKEISETIASADCSLSTTDKVDEYPEPQVDVSSKDPEEITRTESKDLSPTEALTTECKHEGIMVVEGEDNFRTEEQDQIETSKQEQHSELSVMQKTESTAKYLESPLDVASEEIETTASIESVATITSSEEKRPIGGPEEILVETKIFFADVKKEILEEKNPSTNDLDEKIISAEIEIQNEKGNELTVTQPPTEKTAQVGGEKQDDVFISKSGNLVHEAIEVPNKVEKHINESYEANNSPESTVLEHTFTEGVINTDKLEIATEKNPSTIDLDEKIISAEVKIQNKNGNELNVTQTPTEETVQVESEKQDEVSLSESRDQVHEATEVPKEMEKHINRTYEASKSVESTVLEHASTEGAINIDKLDEGCELNYEEKLKEINTLDNIKEVTEQTEKVVDREFQIATEGDNNKKCTIEEGTPVMTITPLGTREEADQQGQEDQNRPNNSGEAASESDSGDQNCSTSNETKNISDQIITKEVIQEYEDHKAENRSEETEKRIKNEHTITDHSPESTCKDTTICSQENEAEAKCKAEIKEELETINGGEGIEEQLLADENKVQDWSIMSSGEELEAESSNENAIMTKFPKEEVLEELQTADGSANIVIQTKEEDDILKDNLAACTGEETKNEDNYEDKKEEKEPDTQANEDCATAGTSMVIEESAISDHPSSSAREKKDAMRSEEVILNSNTESMERTIDATYFSEVREDKPLKDEAKPNEGWYPQSMTLSSEEVKAPNESNLDHAEISSVPEISKEDIQEEILEKAESKVTVAAEEMSLTESEAEHDTMQVDSSKLVSKEKGLLTDETSEIGSNGTDVTTKPAETSNLGEYKDIEIPASSKHGADEGENATLDTVLKTEDQREIATAETSLADLLKENPQAYSSLSLEEQKLVTAEVSEKTGEEDPEKDKTLYGKEETLFLEKTTEMVSEEKGLLTDETSEIGSNGTDVIAKPAETSNLGEYKDIEIPASSKHGADEEENATLDTVLNTNTEDQREIATAETSLADQLEENPQAYSSLSLEEQKLVTAEVSETTGEEDPEKDKTLYGKEETLFLEKTTEENIIEIEDESTTPKQTESTEDIQEIANADAQEEDQKMYTPTEQNNEKRTSELDVETLQGVTASEVDNCGEIGKLETLEDEMVVDEASKGVEACSRDIDTEKAILEQELSVKTFEDSSKEASVGIEKAPVEFEAEGHSHGSKASESKSSSTPIEKVPREIHKADELEIIKEHTIEEESCAEEPHVITERDEMVDKVTDLVLTPIQSCEATASNNDTDIVESKISEDLNQEVEASTVTKMLKEEIKEATEKPVEVSNSAPEVSEENIYKEKADNESITEEKADANDVEVEERKIPDAVSESKDPSVEGIPDKDTRINVGETDTNEVEKQIREVPEALSEPINQGVEAAEDDEIIAPTAVTEVESSREVQLIYKPIKALDSSPEEKSLETTKTADTCEQEAEVDSMKHKEISSTVSHPPIPDHITAEKSEVVNVAVEETKLPDAVSESKDQGVEKVHEPGTSLTGGEIDANEIEKQIREVPEALPEPTSQGVETANNDEIGLVQTLRTENIEEQLQVASSALLSNEEDTETSTIIEKAEAGSTTKDDAEVDNLKLEEASGMDEQLQMSSSALFSDKQDCEARTTFEKIEDESIRKTETEAEKIKLAEVTGSIEHDDTDHMSITIEKSDADYVEVEEPKTSEEISESKDRGVEEVHEIGLSQTMGKTRTNDEEEEIKTVPETLFESCNQGVEATIDGDATTNQALPTERKEKHQEPSSALHKEQDHETTNTVQIITAESTKKDETQLNENVAESFETGATEKAHLQDEGLRELRVSNMTVQDTQNGAPEEESTDLEEATTVKPQECIPEIEYSDSLTEHEKTATQFCSEDSTKDENNMDSRNSNKNDDNLPPPPRPTVEELLPPEVAEKCGEASNLEIEKTGKVLESVSKIQSREVTLVSEGAAIKTEQFKGATTELQESNDHNEEKTEADENIEKDILKEKIAKEKQIAEDYPEEGTNEIFETTRNQIQHGELLEEYEKAGADENTKETATGEEITVEDPCQVSVGDGTAYISTTEEAKEVEISEVMLVKHEKDRTGNEETMTRKDEQLQETDPDVPPVIDADTDEEPDEKIEEDVKPAPEGPTHETIETYEEEKEVLSAKTNNSKSLIESAKLECKSLEPELEENDGTEGSNLKEQEVREIKPSISSCTATSQEEMTDKESEHTAEEKKHDLNSDKQTAEAVSIIEEERSIECEHTEDKEPLELATMGTERELDETKIQSSVAANEDEETQHQNEKPNVLSHIKDAEASHEKGTMNLVEDNEIIQELEKTSLPITDELVASKADPSESTETTHSTASKDIPLMQEDPAAKVFQHDEVEDRTCLDEKIKDQLQVPSHVLLSNEEDTETTTTILKTEDGSTNKDDTEVDNTKLEEASGIASQIFITEGESANNVTVEKADTDEVEVKETKTSDAVSEHKDWGFEETHETGTRPAAENTDTDNMEEETVIIKDDQLENIDLAVPPVMDAAAEEEQDEKVGEKFEEVSEPDPKVATPGAIETCDEKKEIPCADSNNSDSLIDNVKMEYKSLKPTFEENDGTESSNLKEQEVYPHKPSILFCTTTSQEESADKESEKIVDTAKHDTVSDKQTAEAISRIEEGRNIKCEEEHTEDKEQVELSAMGSQRDLDEAKIHCTMAANEDEENQQQNEKPNVLTHIKDTKVSHEKGIMDLAEVNEITHNTQEVEKTSFPISDELNASKSDPSESTETTYSTASKDVPLMQEDQVAKTFQHSEVKDQTCPDEKIEDQLQVPSHVLLSNEVHTETTTTIEKMEDGSTNKGDTEVDNLKLQEASGMASKLLVTECESANNVAVEKTDTDEVEGEETKTLDAVSEHKDWGFEEIHETRISPTAKNTDSDKMEEEIQVVTEKISDPRYQGVEAVIDGQTTDQPLPVDKLEEQLQMSSSTLFSDKQDCETRTTFEKAEGESTKSIETAVDKIKLEEVTGTIEYEDTDNLGTTLEKSDAGSVELEEAKTSEAIVESKVHGVEEIHEIEPSPTVEETHTDDVEKEMKAVPETTFEPNNLGVETITDGDTTANQTLPIEREEQLQEPSTVLLKEQDHETINEQGMKADESTKKDGAQLNENVVDSLDTDATEKPCLQEERSRELEDSNLDLTVQDTQDGAPEEESTSLEEASAVKPQECIPEIKYTDSPTENEETPVQCCSKDTSIDDKASNLEVEKTGKILESVSEFHSPEVAPISEGTEIKTEQLKGGITEFWDSKDHNKETTEADKIIKKDILKEKITEEKQDASYSHPVSLHEETATKCNQEDELRAEDYPGVRINETSEAMRKENQPGELYEESETCGADEIIKEETTAEDITVKDPCQVSAGDATANISLPEEAKDGEVVTREIAKSDLEIQGDETIFSNTATEAMATIKEVESSEVMSVQHEDRTVDNKDAVIIKDDKLENTYLGIPAVRDAVAEEEQDEKVGEKIEEVSETAPTVPTSETIETCEEKNKVPTIDTDNSESLVYNEKLEHKSLELAFEENGVTEGSNLKEREVCPDKPSISFFTATSQEEIAEKESGNTVDKNKYDFLSDKMTAETEPVELSTMGSERKLDEAKIHSTITANEDEETQYQNEKPNVLSQVKYTEASHEKGIMDLAEVNEISEVTQELEKTSLPMSDDHIARKEDPNASTETTYSTASKDVPLMQQDPTAKTFQNAEVKDSKAGYAPGSESEAKGLEYGEEKKQFTEFEESTKEFIPIDPAKLPLSDLLHRSKREPLQVVENLTEERELMGNKEEWQAQTAETAQVEEAKIDEERNEEEGDEHRGHSDPDAPVMVEASRDTDVKIAHKKHHHSILSGVGSKVKHSIAKVKKAITGKSSHSKTTSTK